MKRKNDRVLINIQKMKNEKKKSEFKTRVDRLALAYDSQSILWRFSAAGSGRGFHDPYFCLTIQDFDMSFSRPRFHHGRYPEHHVGGRLCNRKLLQ